jgi:hypothetical protein
MWVRSLALAHGSFGSIEGLQLLNELLSQVSAVPLFGACVGARGCVRLVALVRLTGRSKMNQQIVVLQS